MNDTNDTNPNVTIIIPIRNEADFIERSLSAVLAQDYPADRMEVLVVDGMSTDGTRELVRDLFERAHASTFKQPAPSGAWGSNAPTACPGRSVGFQRANLRLLDNPHQIVPAAMNVGIRAAQGDVIVRVDGHCEIPPHYVRTCVAALELWRRARRSSLATPTFAMPVRKDMSILSIWELILAWCLSV